VAKYRQLSGFAEAGVLIALLAVLGVDLIVLVVLMAFMLIRKRRVRRQPGVFRGAIRVDSGKVDGLRPRWGRGYGRWVRDILVWTKAPLFLRDELVATDGLDRQRPARSNEVKRLGDHPIVIRLKTGRATADVAAGGDDGDLLLGPYRRPSVPTGE
jgi:hypothetical protein